MHQTAQGRTPVPIPFCYRAGATLVAARTGGFYRTLNLLADLLSGQSHVSHRGGARRGHRCRAAIQNLRPSHTGQDGEGDENNRAAANEPLHRNPLVVQWLASQLVTVRW